MYRLLIVDDEPRQLRTLANLVKMLRPEYQIYTANDGISALDFIKKNQIDILFTDIKMSKMSGIELIKKIHNINIKITSIIISGYSEFEYAQSAIRYGVNDYIVKPISKGALELTVSKLEKVLEKESKLRKNLKDINCKLNNSMPVYIEHQLYKWVSGKLTPAEIKDIEIIFYPYRNFGSVLITTFSKDTYKYMENDDKFIEFNKLSIKNILEPFGKCFSFFIDNSNIMVTIFVSKNFFRLDKIDLIKKYTQYIKQLQDSYGITGTIAFGKVNENILEELVNEFNNVKKISSLKFFLGLGRIITFQDVNLPNEKIILNTSEIENEIVNSIKNKDELSILKTMSITFATIKNNLSIDYLKFKEDMYYFIISEVKKIQILLENEKYVSYINNLKVKILDCEEYKALWHNINTILCELIDFSNIYVDDINHIIIKKCKRYLDENYMHEISLESIAKKYCFNPSYFSNLLKIILTSDFLSIYLI